MNLGECAHQLRCALKKQEALSVLSLEWVTRTQYASNGFVTPAVQLNRSNLSILINTISTNFLISRLRSSEKRVVEMSKNINYKVLSNSKHRVFGAMG